MKNIQLLVTEQEIHAFLLSRWKTDVFKQSHESGGFIHGIVDQFAKLPRLFCEMTDDKLERAHFSTWWGAMMLRDDYANPVIADLYQIHELYHAATMPYWPDLAPNIYHKKMEANENGASTLSEIQIYFEMPGLRESSFNHPIYADRYLANPDMQSLWRTNKQVAIETIRLMRENVMKGEVEHEMDLTERWIRKFSRQNLAYSIVWESRYNEVEKHMFDFQVMVGQKGREQALLWHRDWLEAEAIQDPELHIPFRREAERSTQFYWDNKKEYEASMRAEAARLRQHMVSDVALQQKIAARVLAQGFSDKPDQAVHSLGTIESAEGQQVPLHIRHAVDAVITDGCGHVVLITRDSNPGAGLKALPGGFLLQSGDVGKVEDPIDAVFRIVARETGIRRAVLKNAQVTPIGARTYARSFDSRTVWDDMPGTNIKSGDMFTVSTQAFNVRVNGNLSDILASNGGRRTNNVHIVSIEGLTRDQLGIDDHLAMIKQVQSKGSILGS